MGRQFQMNFRRCTFGGLATSESVRDGKVGSRSKPQIREANGVLSFLLGPIEYREDALTLRLLEKEDAWLGVGWRVVHQVHRLGSTAEMNHVDQVPVLNQGQPLRRILERRKIVADLEHAAGNRGQRDGDARLVEGRRFCSLMPRLVWNGLRGH